MAGYLYDQFKYEFSNNLTLLKGKKGKKKKNKERVSVGVTTFNFTAWTLLLHLVAHLLLTCSFIYLSAAILRVFFLHSFQQLCNHHYILKISATIRTIVFQLQHSKRLTVDIMSNANCKVKQMHKEWKTKRKDACNKTFVTAWTLYISIRLRLLNVENYEFMKYFFKNRMLSLLKKKECHTYYCGFFSNLSLFSFLFQNAMFLFHSRIFKYRSHLNSCILILK